MLEGRSKVLQPSERKCSLLFGTAWANCPQSEAKGQSNTYPHGCCGFLIIFIFQVICNSPVSLSVLSCACPSFLHVCCVHPQAAVGSGCAQLCVGVFFRSYTWTDTCTHTRTWVHISPSTQTHTDTNTHSAHRDAAWLKPRSIACTTSRLSSIQPSGRFSQSEWLALAAGGDLNTASNDTLTIHKNRPRTVLVLLWFPNTYNSIYTCMSF